MTETITDLLHRYSSGDRDAMAQLMPLIYGELKSVAHVHLARSSVRQSFNTTALVHEAYEKLTRGAKQPLQNRRHLLATFARAMRQIVVDTYRKQTTFKRGGAGNALQQPLGDDLMELDDPLDILMLADALERLEIQDPELAQLLDLACFAGLDNQQLSELSGRSVRSVQRDLAKARTWIEYFSEPPCRESDANSQ